MPKLKENSIDWLANQKDAKRLVLWLGARNLAVVKAVYITSTTQEVIASYSDMVQHGSHEADVKLRRWMSDMIFNQRHDERYLYFRFQK